VVVIATIFSNGRGGYMWQMMYRSSNKGWVRYILILQSILQA
jgi:hypothetical protein